MSQGEVPPSAIGGASPGKRTLAHRIDAVCDQFETAWCAGKRPRIEDFLGEFQEPVRTAVFKELLLLDIAYRRQTGENPQAADYLARFPGRTELSEQCFQTAPGERTAVDEALLPAPSETGEDTVRGSSHFTQLEYHARGGLGTIFRALDQTLKRSVALKFIQERHLDDVASRQRFLLEAEITGRLDHPGIVPVYALGTTSDGRPFYAMRFIAGITLRSAIDEYHKTDWKGRSRAQRMELHRLIGHLVAACNSIAYAHNRGVVHRDIKPDNIMIGKFNETLVLDWGLAVSVERDERARASGEATLKPGTYPSDSTPQTGAGTIGYMSPEQLPDSTQPMGPSGDIYSLGATLYKLLTGRTTVSGPSNFELWRRIREGDFPRPSQVNAAVSRPLEAICLKALAARPADRYRDALEVAADLRNWMADERVSVYREPRLEGWLRAARRHRSWTASLAGAAVLVLGVMAAASALLYRQADREREVRLEADRVRDASLEQSSMFAARAIADYIDRCWRILDSMASDPELWQLLEAARGKDQNSTEWKLVQHWLDGHYTMAAPVDKSRTARWLIVDATGICLARVPRQGKLESIIGTSLADRDYFYGPTPAEPERPARPVRVPWLSTCLLSRSDADVRLVFSVPIWPAGGQTDGAEPIGVLAMTMGTGQFRVLENAILVDTRPRGNDDASSQRGLVVQHPRLERIVDDTKIPAVDAATLKLFDEIAQRLVVASASRSGASSQLIHPGGGIHEFFDPVDRRQSPAAIAPVVIDDHDEPFKNGRLMVVVTAIPWTEEAQPPESSP